LDQPEGIDWARQRKASIFCCGRLKLWKCIFTNLQEVIQYQFPFVHNYNVQLTLFRFNREKMKIEGIK